MRAFCGKFLAVMAAAGGLMLSSTAFAAFPDPYCVRGYGSGVEPITKVEIDGISNTSPAATGGIANEDFTAIVGQLAPGAGYPIGVQGNNDGGFTAAVAVYFDWNQNGTFDAGEGYYVGALTGSTGTDGQTASTVIPVPAGALPGPTRMRVTKQYTTTPNLAAAPACGTTGYGQAEDYTVNIDPNAPVPPTLAMAIAPDTALVGTTATLTMTLGNTSANPANLTADFTTALPAGLVLATPANASTTCSGTFTAADGSSAITLATGGAILPGGCTITADIVATAPARYDVAAGALSTDQGSGPATSAEFLAYTTGPGGVAYSTGFESPFTPGALTGQQGWFARAWNVATVTPANGAQNIRASSLASPTSTTYPLAISPDFAASTTRFATISANLRLSRTTNGANWRFNPQDPDAGLVTTIVQFNRAATRDIQAIVFDANGAGTFTNTGAQWPVDTYFNFKVIVDRTNGALKMCVDGSQIYEDASGNGTAGHDIMNLAIAQVTGSGQTANNTFDVDDVLVEYQTTNDCVAPIVVTHTVTPSVGTPSGTITPATPQTVNDGDNATFTVAADAGFHIDSVGGTCGGTLTGNAFETDPVTADCTVIANFAPDAAPTFACNAAAEGFDGGSFPPAGWTIDTNEPSGPQWDLSSAWGDGNYTNGSGEAAAVNSDDFGPGTYDTSLVSPTFSLAGFTSASLSYSANFIYNTGDEAFDVDLSDDGGITWTNLLSWAGADHGGFYSTPGEDVVIDLSAWAGQGNLTLRWRYHTPEVGAWDYYAQVDDIGLTCSSGTLTHEVTPSVGTPSGSITPATPQTVNDGATATFTLAADAGFHIDSVGGTCGGTLTGSSFETDPVTADCTVIANFAADSGADIVCAAANHPVEQTFSGTYVRWEDGTFSDGTSVPNANFNPYGTTNLSFFWPNSGAGNAGVGTGTGWSVLSVGDVVGSASPFSTSTGAASNWTVGVDGYLGFRFGCSTATVCYGYAHLTTTAGGGFPATIGDYCWNTAGDPITVGSGVIPTTWTVTPSVGTPSGTITPATPQTVNDGATTTFTLAADAGFHIDSVGGTCGGTLTGSSFQTAPVTADCTVIANFAADAGGGPVAAITPAALSLTADEGDSAATPLNIANTGGGSLTYTITESATAIAPAARSETVLSVFSANPQAFQSRDGRVSADQTAPRANPQPSAVVIDEGFADVASLFSTGGWIQGNHSSPVGASTWAQCGGTAIPPAFDGGANDCILVNFNSTTGAGTISNWLLTSPITFNPGSTASFYTRTSAGASFPDRLEVRLCTTGACTNYGTGATDVGDFTTLLLTINPTLAAGPDPTGVNGYPDVWTKFDLSGLPSTGSGRIAFRYFVTNAGPTGDNSNIIGIDRVVVDNGTAGTTGCDNPSDIPWLSESPTSGAVAGGANTDVTVTANAAGLTAGTYTANVCVATNDPAAPMTTVPVSFTVTAVTPTDPVIGVTPTSLSASQAPGATTTQTLAIANTGGGSLDWTITEDNNRGAAPQAVLYENGPLITNPGAGAGGKDVSALQLNNTAYGSNISISGGFRVADDFVVPAGGWTIDTMTFYAYQTGSPTTSTLNAVNLRIWDGPPDQAGSNIVFGDTTTNRFASTAFTDIYRTTGTDLTNSQRPIMAVVANVGTTLAAGTYWVDWQAGGTLASGPWAPPVTIVGATNKPGANALQWDGTAWAPAADGGSGAPQDYPFLIDGSAGGPPAACSAPSDIPWLSLSPTSGSTAGGTSSNVTVTFDSTGLADGSYDANLCVASNDPATPLVVVPVEMTVATGGGGDVVCTAANHPIAETFDGTYVKWETGEFSDTGSIAGANFNPYNSSGLAFFWPNSSTGNAGVASSATGGTWLVMNPGDVVGPSSIFSTSTGAATNWRAGADGYLGFRFSCTTAAPDRCYGYAHLTTTAGTGFPATIGNFCWNTAGDPITVGEGGSATPPVVTKAFTPDTVPVNTDSVATVTLSNPGGVDAVLTAPLVDTLPAGLTVSAATTTCLVGTGSPPLAPAASVTLPAGVVIPANGSCTIDITVQAAAPGSYVNEIPAGALQTDQGSNAAAATATLTVTAPPSDPIAQVTPSALDFTVDAGDTGNDALVITNIGEGTLNWAITEAPARGFDPNPPSYRNTSAARAAPGTLDPDAAFARSSNALGLFGSPFTLAATDIAQMTDNVPVSPNGVGCGSASAGAADNSWWRRFYFGEHPNVTWPTVAINSVTVASETGVNTPVTINVYTTPASVPVDTIDTSQLTLIGTGSGTVGGDLTTTTVAISAGAVVDDPVGKNLVVEYHIDDGAGLPRFFPGGNPSPQTHNSFISSNACSITNPTPTQDIGFPDFHLIMVVNVDDGGGAPVTGCANPSDIPWLSASPTSGALTAGMSDNVAVTVDATGMAEGSYEANLCVTSNDPLQPLITVPVTLTVNPGPPSDGIFCNGFEDGEGNTCGPAPVVPDIVTSGPVNHAIANDMDGTSVNWITGDIQDGYVEGYHFNPYNNNNQLTFWWSTGAPDIAGVSSSATTSDFLVLSTGAVVGPASTWSIVNNPGPAAWAAGATGYLGFRFNCSSLPSAPPSGICYGYVHLQTTAPDGFPATILDYAYDQAGNPITVP